MRQFIIAVAIVLGLVALWAAIPSLTAEPARTQPALSKALFLCRSGHGIDRTCAAALATALRIDAPDATTTPAAKRFCHVDRGVLTRLADRD
jgi:hypothetical protein